MKNEPPILFLVKTVITNKSDITRILALNGELMIQFGVSSLKLFGSFVKDMQNNQSDVDVLIEFEPDKKTFDNFLAVSELLENLFGRKVELITPESLSTGMKKAILSSCEDVFRRN